jgi:hypothetical protein
VIRNKEYLNLDVSSLVWKLVGNEHVGLEVSGPHSNDAYDDDDDDDDDDDNIHGQEEDDVG